MDDRMYASAKASDQTRVFGSSSSLVGEKVRESATVSAILKRSIEVSENIGGMQQLAFALAAQTEDLVNRLAGQPPSAEGSLNTCAGADVGPREPGCAIDLLFEAVDGLNPQVSALHSPLARIQRALGRLHQILN